MKSITGVTKSPEESLSAGERKHQLWQAVEASEVKFLFVIKLMMRSSVERRGREAESGELVCPAGAQGEAEQCGRGQQCLRCLCGQRDGLEGSTSVMSQ